MEGQLIGRYRVVRRLGEGGMGMVFEAVREDIGGRAAIKVLRPELANNPEIATRFFNEARAANLVEHPGIVRVFDYGNLPSGMVYLAMEYLEGESLGGRIKRKGRMAPDEAIRLGRQITGALAAAHAKKVIHRDLKPANVMLVPNEEAADGENIKIVDFGIAKLAQDGKNIHTRTGSLMGTPIYMSPEQCRGAVTVDEKSDVYSFGVMFFEMLVGQPPFVAEGQGDLIAMHMFAPPPPLQSYVPGLPPELLSLMERILAKDPAARPSMAQVAAEFQRLAHRITASGALPAIAVQQTVRTVAPVPFAGPTYPPPVSAAGLTYPAPSQPSQPSGASGALYPQPMQLVSASGAPYSQPSQLPSLTGNSFELQSGQTSARRPRTAMTAALALLLLGGGVVTYRFLLRPPASAEAEASRLLAEADGDLANKRWSEAAGKANSIINNPAVSAATRTSADSRRVRAEQEGQASHSYTLMLSAGDNYDQALQRYHRIPADSVYHASAREAYDKVFPLFVDKHLQDAEAARGSGQCSNFRREVQAVLGEDPKQVKALALKEQPCADASAKGAGSADADQLLSDAQSEYVNGNFAQAITIASSVQRINPTRAWRIIGSSACNTKDLKLVGQAFKHLDSASRQYLIYTCQRQGVINTNGAQFKLKEE